MKIQPIMSKKIKVFMVEDNLSYIEGFQALFQNDERIELCGFSSNAPDTFDLVSKLLPDVVLMDNVLRNEALNGIEISAKLLEAFPALKIIMLTNYDDPPIVENALRKGLYGYILKDHSTAEIKLAIETVVSGLMVVEKSLFHQPSGKTAAPKSLLPHPLTPGELKIACLIAQGLSSKDIADRLFISANTVDTHRKNTYVKLDVHTAVELANKLRTIGILFED